MKIFQRKFFLFFEIYKDPFLSDLSIYKYNYAFGALTFSTFSETIIRIHTINQAQQFFFQWHSLINRSQPTKIEVQEKFPTAIVFIEI